MTLYLTYNDSDLKVITYKANEHLIFNNTPSPCTPLARERGALAVQVRSARGPGAVVGVLARSSWSCRSRLYSRCSDLVNYFSLRLNRRHIDPLPLSPPIPHCLLFLGKALQLDTKLNDLGLHIPVRGLESTWIASSFAPMKFFDLLEATGDLQKPVQAYTASLIMVVTYGHPARGTQDSFLARTQELLDVAWHLLSAERTAVFRPYPIRLTDAGWHLHDEGRAAIRLALADIDSRLDLTMMSPAADNGPSLPLDDIDRPILEKTLLHKLDLRIAFFKLVLVYIMNIICAFICWRHDLDVVISGIWNWRLSRFLVDLELGCDGLSALRRQQGNVDRSM
ncbi:hypothetical protein BD769DRAFT_1395367 [Suillus cothurnatus]|nr:hypothetical protein BD769DRAFT_1395367 [Suillus cothurnatus]